MNTSFVLTSNAFADGEMIPLRYTCDLAKQEGGMHDMSPALGIQGVPPGTKSLTLIMDDPDIPKVLRPSGVFDHWVLFNISPATHAIPEGGSAGTTGVNSAGTNMYRSPCPPAQYEPSEHRYVFTLYALDTELPLERGATKDAVISAMQGHIIAQTQLTGRYKRK